VKVILRADWFVEGRRYRKSVSRRVPTDIPNRLKDRLPSSAEIVNEEEYTPVVDNSPSAMTMRFFKDALHQGDRKPVFDPGAGSNAAQEAMSKAEAAAAEEAETKAALAAADKVLKQPNGKKRSN